MFTLTVYACAWAFLVIVVSKVSGQGVVISEISDKGTTDVCEGEDWVEVYNSGSEAVDLDGYALYDNKGISSPDVFYFPPGAGSILPADGYLLLCTRQTAPDATSMSPQFGIGGDDTVTLAILNNSNSTGVVSSYEIISTVGPLPNTDDDFDVTYALASVESGVYNYTSTPTPGASNVITEILSQVEKDALRKAKLAEQNMLGERFFNMDNRGYPVPDAMDQILDLHITMTEPDYQYLLHNRSYEVYRPFQTAKVTSRNNPEDVLLELNSPGRIRPKGQFTLFYATCLDTMTSPFQIDFSRTNASQTLFGSEQVYLRTHVGDNSYARDWAYYRMAARFGLPHARARKVRLLLNGELQGYYTLMEAVDQEHVFARSFPNYNPSSFALYKVKTASLGCGSYSDGELVTARARAETDTATPPYAFERGEHKPVIEPVGFPSGISTCVENFFASIFQNLADARLAYVRHDESCPDMLVEEGLIDRDLGTSNWDNEMKELIQTALAGNADNWVDLPDNMVDIENSLKMMAFYAVTMNSDSPLGNGNNYYWAESGEGKGWSIFPYDFNAASTVACNEQVCNLGMVHWSIARPTCVTWEEHPWVGPLLANPERHAQYLEYVREFVDTVYANQTFVQQLQDHIQAQAEDVRSDFWSFGGENYDAELTPEASKWEEEERRFPLLPTMKARAADVRAQLAAIDAGTYPRGPHGVGVGGDYEDWETCPNWQLSEPAQLGGCIADCRYEGCFTPGWTLEGFCAPDEGKCYHGDYDELCSGIPDVGRYDGMEDRNGQYAFCFAINGVPTKLSECPAPPEGFQELAPPCPEDCQYEGCNMEGWVLPSFCNAEERKCYHGDQDDSCEGIPDLERYDGMEDREGRGTVCFSISGVPTKMSECPDYVMPESADDGTPAVDEESDKAEEETAREPDSPTSGGLSNLLLGHWGFVQAIAIAVVALR